MAYESADRLFGSWCFAFTDAMEEHIERLNKVVV